MKHFYIAYRHTGEDIMELEKRIRTVETAMATNDVKVYATLFDEESFQAEHKSAGQIMESAFQKIAAMDGLFVPIMGDAKSEGQLMEVGYAYALKKPIIVAVHKSANTYVHELASHTFVFDDLADLSTKIMGLEL